MRFRSTSGSRRWAPKLAALAMFAALCGTATWWALQLFAPRAAIAPSVSMVDWQKAPELSVASRLFGVPSSDGKAGPVELSNIKVLGVAASENRGSAVLAIDGGPAKAFLAGDMVDKHIKLIEVRSDVVVIEQNGGRIELATPARPDVALLSAGPASPAASAGPAPAEATPMAPMTPMSPGSMTPMRPAGPSARPAPDAPAPPPQQAPMPAPDTPNPAEAANPAPPADSSVPDSAPPDGTEGSPGVTSNGPMPGNDGSMSGAPDDQNAAPLDPNPGASDPNANPQSNAYPAQPAQPATPAGAGGLRGAGGFRGSGGIRGG